jgi:hypothetical protein
MPSQPRKSLARAFWLARQALDAKNPRVSQ